MYMAFQEIKKQESLNDLFHRSSSEPLAVKSGSTQDSDTNSGKFDSSWTTPEGSTRAKTNSLKKPPPVSIGPKAKRKSSGEDGWSSLPFLRRHASLSSDSAEEAGLYSPLRGPAPGSQISNLRSSASPPVKRGSNSSEEGMEHHHHGRHHHHHHHHHGQAHHGVLEGQGKMQGKWSGAVPCDIASRLETLEKRMVDEEEMVKKRQEAIDAKLDLILEALRGSSQSNVGAHIHHGATVVSAAAGAGTGNVVTSGDGWASSSLSSSAQEAGGIPVEVRPPMGKSHRPRGSTLRPLPWAQGGGSSITAHSSIRRVGAIDAAPHDLAGRVLRPTGSPRGREGETEDVDRAAETSAQSRGDAGNAPLMNSFDGFQ
jgi:hypothetical protein